MEVGLNAETAWVGGAAGTVGLIFLRKFFQDWINSRPQLATANAVAEQVKMLQGQITSQQTEIRELRGEVSRMDATIHRQQTKLTRTEMLLRQFVGLVQQHGTPVPSFMQAEVDDLLNQEVL